MAELYIYRNLFLPLNVVPWPLLLVVLFFSIVIHEVAHGAMALKCGDDTALHMGRITLNPAAHIDPVGTILVPVLLVILPTRFVFGWAKPVPVNPYNFYDIRKGTILVGISGAASNFALAFILALFVRILNIAGAASGAGFTVVSLLAAGVTVNIILGLFNLVPIPPLDGSRVVSALLPYEAAQRYESVGPYGLLILFLLLGVVWQFIAAIGNIFYRLLFIGLPL